MTQMTTAQSRIVDPLITEIARGYKNGAMIGELLFPSVPVVARAGKIIKFGKEDFELYQTARAPGTNTKRINFGYSDSHFALEQHALEAVVPFELADESARLLDLMSVSVQKVKNVLDLRKEIAQAAIATTAANYPVANKVTLAGSSQWNDPNSTPINDIEIAKEAIRIKTGKRPNTVAVGPAVMAKLRTHPQIVDRIKYSSREVATEELLAALFGVERVACGDAVFEDADGAMQDAWGKFCIVAYTATAGLADMGLPSYGYTYQLRGYPIVEVTYQDRNAKSHIAPVTDETFSVIAGPDAGYLISAAVA